MMIFIIHGCHVPKNKYHRCHSNCTLHNCPSEGTDWSEYSTTSKQQIILAPIQTSEKQTDICSSMLPASLECLLVMQKHRPVMKCGGVKVYRIVRKPRLPVIWKTFLNHNFTKQMLSVTSLYLALKNRHRKWGVSHLYAFADITLG